MGNKDTQRLKNVSVDFMMKIYMQNRDQITKKEIMRIYNMKSQFADTVLACSRKMFNDLPEVSVEAFYKNLLHKYNEFNNDYSRLSEHYSIPKPTIQTWVYEANKKFGYPEKNEEQQEKAVGPISGVKADPQNTGKTNLEKPDKASVAAVQETQKYKNVNAEDYTFEELVDFLRKDAAYRKSGKDTAKEFGITNESVSSIKDRAYLALRKSEGIKYTKEYLIYCTRDFLLAEDRDSFRKKRGIPEYLIYNIPKLTAAIITGDEQSLSRLEKISAIYKKVDPQQAKKVETALDVKEYRMTELRNISRIYEAEKSTEDIPSRIPAKELELMAAQVRAFPRTKPLVHEDEDEIEKIDKLYDAVVVNGKDIETFIEEMNTKRNKGTKECQAAVKTDKEKETDPKVSATVIKDESEQNKTEKNESKSFPDKKETDMAGRTSSECKNSKIDYNNNYIFKYTQNGYFRLCSKEGNTLILMHEKSNIPGFVEEDIDQAKKDYLEKLFLDYIKEYNSRYDVVINYDTDSFTKKDITEQIDLLREETISIKKVLIKNQASRIATVLITDTALNLVFKDGKYDPSVMFFANRYQAGRIFYHEGLRIYIAK